jgi:RNA polymerase sigma factor (sigma-70 family)
MTPRQPSPNPIDQWLVETSQGALGYAVTLTRNREDAEDIVHDCYSRLLAKAGEYDLPRDGKKLLYRAITNACINRTQRHAPETSLDQLQWASGEDRHALADRRTAEPIQGAILRELEQAVAEAMNELPVAQRAAVELRSLGHTLVEVAEMLEVSHANARVILHRARETLAVRLQPFIEDRNQ